MATRIVQISDLHFPAADVAQVGALAASIADAGPDLIAVTGDLTRRGRRHEFAAAAAFLAALPSPKLVVPGNHDVPLLRDRFRRPFARFAEYLPGQPLWLETADVFLIGFNSAVGVNPRGWDWSLGDAPDERVAPVAALLREKRGDRLAVVACHHPLRRHALDVRRSVTRRGPEAFNELAAAGMRLLLHGHLHRSSRSCVAAPGGEVCEVCANTALSDRERSGPAAYNIIDVEDGRWKLDVMQWRDGHYMPSEMSLSQPGIPAA